MKKRILPLTEKRNPRSRDIDRLTTLGIVRLINSEDRLVVPAVGSQARAIAAGVEMIVERFRRGGRLF